MTSYVTVIGFEFVGPLDGYAGDQWAVRVSEHGRERVWLYTNDPGEFTVEEDIPSLMRRGDTPTVVVPCDPTPQQVLAGAKGRTTQSLRLLTAARWRGASIGQ